MATATKSTKSEARTAEPTGAGLTRAERIIAEKSELLEAAEELLRLEAAGTPNPDAGAIYVALGWDKKRVGLEVQRMQSVQRLFRKAGTKAERAAAAKAAEDARSRLEFDRPTLRSEIARLEKKERDLEAAVIAAQQKVHERSQAADSLRQPNVLPNHIALGFQMDHSASAHPDRHRLSAARGRVKEIDSVLAMDPRSPSMLDAVRLHCNVTNTAVGPVLMQWGSAPFGRANFPDEAWEAYRGRLTAERGPLVQLVEELGPPDAERQKLVDARLDYYLAKIG